MADIPVVSVIIPLYNKRPYVKRAIESVRQQTFSRWELIIVDDGSTDGSADEIPADDPRIRILRQTNRGPSSARNRGIEAAQGEVITFLDADDYYYPGKLKEETDLLLKEQLAEWMISAFDYESGSDEIRTQYIKDIDGEDIKGDLRVFGDALHHLQRGFWPVDGLCVKRDLLKRIGGFNEGLRCYEIAELIFRCALEQPKIAIYAKPLYRVVDVTNSAFKIQHNKIEGERRFGERLYKLAKDFPAYEDILLTRSNSKLVSYVFALLRSGQGREARRYLATHYPYAHDRVWWKLWIGSCFPQWLFQPLYKLLRLMKRKKTGMDIGCNSNCVLLP
ncbi:MAG: glycosyltransferase family 2 protein [Nitrospirota bacterium]